jgi:hypothetical protein
MESRGWDIPVSATDAINEPNLRFVIPTAVEGSAVFGVYRKGAASGEML